MGTEYYLYNPDHRAVLDIGKAHHIDFDAWEDDEGRLIGPAVFYPDGGGDWRNRQIARWIRKFGGNARWATDVFDVLPWESEDGWEFDTVFTYRDTPTRKRRLKHPDLAIQAVW